MLKQPDAMPTFRCSEKPEAITVNTSAGDEEKPQKHVEHKSDSGDVSELHSGMVHKPVALKTRC